MSGALQYGLAGSLPGKRRSLRLLYAPFVLLLAVSCMSLATQRTAEYFQYHDSLGSPFFGGFYLPWMVFLWKATFPASDPYGFMARAIEQSQLLYLFPQYVVMGLWLFFSPRLKGNEVLHGSARWASEEDIRSMGYFDGKGVYIGGYVKKLTGIAYLWAFLLGKPRERLLYLREDGPAHALCYAPTRSGKGVSIVIPCLLSWPHSLICLDIKGENWALTSGYRKSQGQICLRFDLSDASGASCRFNPFAEVRLDTIQAIPDCQNLATMLVDPNGAGLEDHWAKAGFGMLSGAILHCCIKVRAEEGRDATLYDLSCMLADETQTVTEVFEGMVKYDHKGALEKLFPKVSNIADCGLKAHVFVASAAKELLNKSENEGSGVVSTVLVNLSLYRDPVVAAATFASDFRLVDLMNHEKPLSLFLVISPADIDRVKPLVRLMVDMIVRRVCQKMEFADGTSKASYRHRLLVFLDEFTSLGKLPIMERALAYAAGYGAKCFLIVQDTVQLASVYGEKHSILGNCHVRIAFAPAVLETAQQLSDMTGKTTAIDRKTSLSGSEMGLTKSASISVNETARNLLTADETMRLPGMVKDRTGKVVQGGDMLVFTAGRNPIYGRQTLYFLDPTFSARAKIPPAGATEDFPGGISDSLYFEMPFPILLPISTRLFRRARGNPSPPERPNRSNRQQRGLPIMRTHSMFPRSLLCFCMAVFFALAVCWSAGLRLQVTRSMPVGLYQLQETDRLQVGDIVSFCLPPGHFAELAKQRGYLQESKICPSGVRPLVKQVAGLPGDTVDTASLAILPADSLHRPLSSVLSSGVIPDGFALVLSPHKGSFDSRYFGLVPFSTLKRVTPVFIYGGFSMDSQKRLAAAAAAVMDQITTDCDLAVPLPDDVAEYMGAFEESAVTPEDFGMESILAVAADGGVYATE